MHLPAEIIENYKKYSTDKLNKIIFQISKINELKKYTGLCIYVGGALGRHEGNPFSGIDLFLIKSGKQETQKVSKLSKTIIDAELIRIIAELGFPSFSNDGEFLNIHYLENIIEELGIPDDDGNGSLTARMSLLLEGCPVYNEDFYYEAGKTIVSAYCNNDLYISPLGFTPVFLVNDIIRYWKTLHLYGLYQKNDDEKNEWGHVYNFKVIFSKKIACYSFIMLVMSRHKTLTEDFIFEIIKMKPIQRLVELKRYTIELEPLVDEIIKIYTSFISLNDQPQNSLIKYIDNKEKQKEIFHTGSVNLSQKILEVILILGKDSPEIFQHIII
ncbi:MAG: hypothetical protein K2Q21_08970 [Chitinophagaceae bacterium]|nr:hypothetical protein [Chitinophagaceae bacterium]